MEIYSLESILQDQEESSFLGVYLLLDDFNHSIASLQDSVVEERHHGLNMLGVLSTEGYQVSHLSFYDQTRLFLHQTVASNMLGELGLDRVDTREVEVSSYKNKQTFLYSFASSYSCSLLLLLCCVTVVQCTRFNSK